MFHESKNKQKIKVFVMLRVPQYCLCAPVPILILDFAPLFPKNKYCCFHPFRNYWEVVKTAKHAHEILVLISNAQNPPSNASRGESRFSGNLGFVCKRYGDRSLY